ncbi:hypothetical protein J132_03172 [Termitomyces sp. J132]|nr:hypothetical protein J132_03172 [Termitomyces sp. J132]
MRLAGVPGENCPLLESLSIKGVAIPSSANMGAEDATLLFAPRLSTLRLNNLPGNALAYLTGCTGCKYWREITLATPSLWVSLHIPIIYSRHPPLSEVETVTRSLILRKSVQSWLVGEPDVLGNDLGTALFNLLTSYSRRWKSFEWTGSTLLPPLLALTPDEVPILESLSINVILRLKNMPGPLLKCGVSWSNITELFIACHNQQQARAANNPLTPDVILTVLSRCNKLVSCYLEATEVISYELPQLRKHITLPSLEKLTAKPPMVKLISLSPALETFVFNPDYLTFQATMNCLTNAPTITTLVMKPESFYICPIMQCEDGHFINAPPLLDDEIIQRLTATRQLPTTSPSSFTRLNETVKLLAPVKRSTSSSLPGGPGIPQLCPFLQNFEFGYSNYFTEEALLRFIQTRTTISEGTKTKRLQRVKGEVREHLMKVDFEEALAAEISAGFKLELDYQTKVEEVTPLSGIYWNYKEEDCPACECCFDFQDHVR